MSYLNFSILAFSINFCRIKIDPSGNTVWPQASGFQKLAKNWLFSVLLKNFYPVRMYDFYDFQTPWCFLFFFSWKCTNFTTKEGLTKKFESANSFDLKMYSNFIKADINLPDAQLDFFKDCSRHIFKAKATTSII